MASFHSHHKKKGEIPETVVGEEGSAKRNILRKGGASQLRKGNVVGAGVDDGTTYDDPAALDTHDPNYDSEEDAGNEYAFCDTQVRAYVAEAKLTLPEYKRLITPIISEYFIHCDIDEVLRAVQEIEAPEYSYEFVKKSINMSCDKGDRERELVSKMISFAYPDILSSNMIGKGFERLFELVDEIEKDVPAAKELLAIFLTRAVVDEVLPPSFLADAVVCNLGGDIVEQSKKMLSLHHGGAKLERSWGPGDGRPVEELKIAIDQAVQEYILSEDIEEAVRCIIELQVPQFHHEVVKRAIVLSLDLATDKQVKISQFLAILFERERLTPFQIKKGFDRLHLLLSDLVLDTPLAAECLDGFVTRAKQAGLLSHDYVPPAPSPPEVEVIEAQPVAEEQGEPVTTAVVVQQTEEEEGKE